MAAVWQVCGLKGPDNLRLILREQVPKNYIYLEKWMKKRAQLGTQISIPHLVMAAWAKLSQVNPHERYQYLNVRLKQRKLLVFLNSQRDFFNLTI